MSRRIPKDIIRADSVVKILGNRVILYDVNLDVKQGEILGIIGASGSGKTTLLRTLIGFFKPEKGDVLIRSSLVPGHSHELYTSISRNPDEAKRVFGFASQHPSVYLELSAEENLSYFATLHGLPKQEREKTADILLSLMDLQPARKTLGANLSGGMQRRLDIACAMIHRPKVLILDEPTADLDPFLRQHIWDMIRKINEQGTTVIVSSHQLADVEMICDRVAIVHQGKIVAVNSPDRIKKQFLKTETIRIQTYPGRYANLKKMLDHRSIINVDIEGQQMVITTTNAEASTQQLLRIVQEAKESVTSINVISSSLDEVFLQLTEENE